MREGTLSEWHSAAIEYALRCNMVMLRYCSLLGTPGTGDVESTEARRSSDCYDTDVAKRIEACSGTMELTVQAGWTASSVAELVAGC